MTEFDDALTLTSDGTDSLATLGDGWVIGNAVNGGVLMALAATALGRAVGSTDGGQTHDTPLAFSAHFMAPCAPGPARLRTKVLSTGRSLSTGQVSLSQADAEGVEIERLRALATFGNLDAKSEPAMRHTEAPAIPSPEECQSASDRRPDFLQAASLLDRVEIRLDPASAGWAVGRPSMAGRLNGWIRFPDAREPDAVSLLFFLDALPPVVFDLGLLGWAPTLQFTAHLRAKPQPGWLQVSLATDNVAGGLFEEDALIWDSTGRLVAQSRQLAGVRMPRPPA